jgi:hypothetical protein
MNFVYRDFHATRTLPKRSDRDHGSSQSTFFFDGSGHSFQTLMGADVRFQWNEFTSGDVLKRTGQGFQFLFGNAMEQALVRPVAKTFA